MIDILIPTFNRSSHLVKNIKLLDSLVKDENLQGKFRLLISDNNSTDDTYLKIESLKTEIEIEIEVYRQEINLGLEKNAVFTLSKSSSDYVMYLGDDDFLPQGYLSFVVKSISENEQLGALIPGFSALYADGSVQKARKDYKYREHKKGFLSVLDFSSFGHQLSGLVFKRKNLLESYCSDHDNRNIYLFIYFLSYCLTNYDSIYAPQYQVLVSQGNSKDWAYDDSGLLTEIFKNYQSLYRYSRIKQVLASCQFVKRQAWRLRIRIDPLQSIIAVKHILTSEYTSTYIKLGVTIFYPSLYIYEQSRCFMRFIKRVI